MTLFGWICKKNGDAIFHRIIVKKLSIKMKFCRRGRIHLATNFFDLNFLPTPNKIILSFPMSTSWREGMHEVKVFSIQDWIISSTVLRPKSLFSPTTVMSDLEIGFSKNLPKCIMTSSDNNNWKNSLKYLLTYHPKGTVIYK